MVSVDPFANGADRLTAEVQVAGEVGSGDYEGAEARKVAYAASSVATSCKPT